MKKIILTLFLIYWTIMLQAQFFNNDIAFPSEYENSLSNKSSCLIFYDIDEPEPIAIDNIVTVGAIEALDGSPGGGGGGSPGGLIAAGQRDAILTVHDQVGWVTRSWRYGFDGVDEAFTAVEHIGDFHLNEVMAVGYKQMGSDLDMFFARIDVGTGMVLCSQTVGMPGTDERAEAIFRVEPTKEDFIIVGTTTIAGNPRIFAIRIDENCNVVWSRSFANIDPAGIFDTLEVKNITFNPVYNPHDLPNNLGYDVGEYVVVGNYKKYAGDSDIFTMAFDAFGDLSKPIHIYANTAGDEAGVDIVKTFTGYALTYYTQNPTGIPLIPSVNSYISLLEIDFNLDQLSGIANYYWVPGRTENYGVGLYWGGVGFNIATYGYDNGSFGGVPHGIAGLLQLGVGGAPVGFQEYDFITTRNAEVTSMYRGQAGYYIKATTNKMPAPYDQGYTLISTDFQGDDRQGCFNLQAVGHAPAPISQQVVPTLGSPQAFINYFYILDTVRHRGYVSYCQGGSLPFRKSSPTPATQAAKLYPTLLSSYSGKLNIEFESEEAQQLKLAVYNTLGQQVYTQAYAAQAGKNTFWTASTNLPNGVSIVGLLDADGLWVLREKVLKQ